MTRVPINPVLRAAIALEVADGHVQAIAQGGGNHLASMEDAVFNRDSCRNAFAEALREATGMAPRDIARALAL